VKLLLLIIFSMTWKSAFPQADKFTEARADMVRYQIYERGIVNNEILKAMRKVPRHLFVPVVYEKEAYDDYPLPIGFGQTISQPYVVAYMTEAVKPNRHKKVLEIGTGSGYQAAVLSELTDTVYTIEIIPELASEAKARLKNLGYKNIICKSGDGYNGWSEHAPFDIIIVTAAASEIPKPLVDQLAENGRLVIPVGESGYVQELMLLINKNGKIEKKRLAPVRFVPLKRQK
jgi:protein-L-isoaspartate(D-aspartate) O-methyltransferase